ncbi:MAG TPA: hypothetical protein DEQ34_10420 [Balneolaceae bacterium]|nr:hypothetical protein [Balneolaceae bacterium]|tara:strand:- start:54955 stop:56256 length:1302 start_codon:yes stop_codon:yes gene_type:complete
MKLKKVLIPAVLFISVINFQSSAKAQLSEAKSGSIYSFFGVGQPVDIESSAFKGYGGFGLSNVNQEMFGLQNPGLWGFVQYTQAISGADLSTYKTQTTSQNGGSTNFEATKLHVLFPIKNGKLGLSLALFPVTRSSFDIVNTGTFEAEGEEIIYANELTSYGGVNKFEAGLGFRLTNNISIGYAPSVAFLSLSSTENFSFTSGLFSSHSQVTKYSGAAFAQRFGLAAKFRSFLRRGDQISFGATYSLPYQIGTNATLTTDKTYNSTNETIDLSEQLYAESGDVQMPMEFGAGLGYAPSRYVNFNAEMQVQQWGNYSNALVDDSGYQLTDRTRFGFGGQYHPYKRGLDTFFSSFKYSAGLSYDTGHLVVQNENISTLWINTGLGILSRGLSSIDLSLRYGFRGTTNSNLIEERIWSLGVSVNLAEVMFIRPKLR